jgi:hypothetical protein
MKGIYLGTSGQVFLERSGIDVPISATLLPSDVNTVLKRWSADFKTGSLITGDRINISRTDGGNLQLVSGHSYPDGSWYCNVDPVGGIKLYNTYQDALNGTTASALSLVTPSTSQNIEINLATNRTLCVANITAYDITTSRETIDITSLGEEFRKQYEAGLMSGQGTLSCLWNYKDVSCPAQVGQNAEAAHYFSQLVLRLQLGAKFKGYFYILHENTTYGVNGADESSETSLWWEADCVVTNVGMQFSPSDPILSQIEFVTTGPIAMRMGATPAYLLQENGDRILQEDGISGILLE